MSEFRNQSEKVPDQKIKTDKASEPEVKEKSEDKLDTLQIELTTLCNAKCIYCPRHHRQAERGKNIDAESIIEQFRVIKGKVKTILLQGDGEPQLYKELPQFLDATHDIAEAKTQIVTNMSIYRPEVFDRCDSVVVSLDSLRPTYKARRGIKTQRVIHNLERLKKDYPDLQTVINSVISHENTGDLEDLIEFAKKLKVKVNLVPQIGDALPEVTESDIEKINAVISKNPNVIINPTVFSSTKSQPSFSQLYINVEGTISPSCHQTDIKLGHVKEDLSGLIDEQTRNASESEHSQA